jgi:hypothetical protein
VTYRTCRRCGCQYNRAGNLVCVECHALLALPRRPRRPHPAAPQPAGETPPPSTLPVPFGPRAGEPVSATRLALSEDEELFGSWRAEYVLVLIVAAAGLLVILAVRGM